MKHKLILLIFGVLSSMAVYGATYDLDSLRYTLNDDGTATVTSCLYKSTPAINIPQTVTSGGITYTVKRIADYAFDGRRFITSVTFPSTLEYMGYCSFRYCSGLTAINIPASLKALSSSNFSQCTSLQTVTIASGSQMTKVDVAAFYNCNQMTDINLPATVTEIGPAAFYSCKSLSSIAIPSVVTNIGYEAFEYCSSLTSITLPSALTTLGNKVFRGCEVLQTVSGLENTGLTAIPSQAFTACYQLSAVTLPSTVTSIGDGAFSECKALPSINIPSGVTSIGNQGFYNCEALTSVNLPSALTTLGQDAFCYCKALQTVNNFEHTQVTSLNRAVFYQCEALTSIALPPTLKTLGNEVFRYCKALTNVDLGSLESAGEYVFANCGLVEVTIPATMTTVARDFLSYCDQLESVIITEGVTSLARGVFYEDDALSSVVLPSTLTTIGEYAFAECKGLTSIAIPANVTTIGNNAFNKCSALTAITIPAKVTTIGEYAFQYCSMLETVDMKPQTMTSIGRNAFDVCEKLTSFRVPEGITELGQSVFWGCKALQELTLPSTLTSLGVTVCRGCESLTSISFPAGLTTIGEGAFRECKQLGNITLPAALTSLGTYAFYQCETTESVTFLGNGDVTLPGESQFSSMKNLKSIKLPDNLSTITRSMFYGCEQLQSIDMSKLPVTEIRPYAFFYCGSLASAQLPNAVNSIGDHAFYSCRNLATIQFPTTLRTIDSEAFEYAGLTTLQLNEGLETINRYAFANCDVLTTVTFPNNLTTLGEYVFDNCDELRSVVFPKDLTALPRSICGTCKKLESIVLPDNLQTIGQYAFYEANSLKTLVLPQTVQTIDNAAFYNTKSLDAVTLPSSMKTVGEEAFHYSMMPSLTLNEGLETIGKNAFRECDRIKEVTIPSTLTTLGHAAFWTCDSLRTVTFPEQMESLNFTGDSHFAHNAQMVKVTMPKTGITTLPDYMFYDCDRLFNIELPTSLTTINRYVFSGCDSLQTIYIPDGVTSIGYEAFRSCIGLRYVRLPEGLETIGQSCFAYCEKLPFINIPSTVTNIGNWAIHTTATSSNTNFKSIGIMGSTMPGTADHVFWQYQPAFSLLVPSGQEETYLNSTSWTPDMTDNRTIKGYSATKQTLTQDLIHLSMLNNETYFSGSPAAVWVDWFEGMGNYRVWYTDAKGNRTTTLPSAGGNYTLSLEFEEGPYYKPATFNNIGTFSIKEIADEDFALLWDFYSKTYDWTKQKSTWTGNGGGGKKANWQLIEGVKESAVNIFGVKWNNGHVEEINFGTGTSIYNLNANETPVSLFALPQVKKIEIAGGELYGNISDKVEEWLTSGKTLSPTLEYLDLQRNKLEGNISTLVNALPALKTLDVHENRFSTLWPALPERLENLNISNQTITDIVATVDLRDMTDAGFFSTLPSIVFYDPDTRTYADNIKIGVQSQSNWNSFTVNYNGSNDFAITGNCLWKGASGDVAKCTYADSKNKTTNFNAHFFYDMGDVDFNGLIDVSDLQQSINYLFRDGYYPNSRYNFTAGDLNVDNDLNVLDIVKHVDILLSQESAGAMSPRKARQAGEELPEASLYQDNGILILNTSRPVAALDIFIKSVDGSQLSTINSQLPSGMTVSQKEQPDGNLHLIIYSLSGKAIPVGKAMIATGIKGTTVNNAVLVDEDARKLTVALNDASAVITSVDNLPLSRENETGAVYDLQGRKITDNNQQSTANGQLPKGIYIINGKKVIIK